MELKVELKYPYTEEERANFIVEQNHNNGYEIREHATSFTVPDLQAWGPDDIEKLEAVRQTKLEEALRLANEYQQMGSVEHKNCVFEMSDSNRKNLSDTEEALKLQGVEETTWLDKNDNYVTLTVDDIQYIRLNLILAAIQKLWIIDYPHYKEEIEAARTIEEIEAIEIDYDGEALEND